MPALRFPFRASDDQRLHVVRTFPSDTQLDTLTADDWLATTAAYRITGTGLIDVQAPADAYLRFRTRRARGIDVNVLELKLDKDIVSRAFPGWSAPTPTSFVIQYSELADPGARETITRRALETARDRGLRQIIDSDFDDDDQVHSFERLGLAPTPQSTIDLVLAGRAMVPVVPGQVIASTNNEVSLGMVNLSEPRGRSATWYWMDAHELFRRLRHAYSEDEEIRFPFSEEPSRDPFRIWFENSSPMDFESGRRLIRISGGLQQVNIFQPPVERPPVAGAPLRALAIPKELLLLTSSGSITLEWSGGSTGYALSLFRDAEAELTLATNGPFTSERAEVLLSTIGYAFQDSRTTPYQLTVAGSSSGVGVTFHVLRNLFQSVAERTRNVFEKRAAVVEFVHAGDNAVMAKMAHNINNFLRAAGSGTYATSIRDALGGTRFQDFRVLSESRVTEAQQAISALQDALNDDFFRQLVATPTEDNFEILNSALEALSNDAEGDDFLRQKFRGVMFPESLGPHEIPELGWDILKNLWNSQTAVRRQLMQFLVRIVVIDIFEEIRRLPSTDLITYRLDLIRRFETYFGELTRIRTVRTLTTFEHDLRNRHRATMGLSPLEPTRYQNVLFEVDTAHPDLQPRVRPDGSTEDPRHSGGISSVTRTADALQTTIAYLNLVGTLYGLWNHLLDAGREGSTESYYELVHDIVSALGDLSYILPGRYLQTTSARPGWSQFGRGFGIVFSTVSIGRMISESAEYSRSGNYIAANFEAAAIAGAAVSLGAEGLILLGASSTGPIGWIVVGGALFAIWAGFITPFAIQPELIVDLQHSVFGNLHQNLRDEYDALDPVVRADPAQLYSVNKRFSWVDDLGRQLGHLNNYLFPLNATMRSEEIDHPSAPGRRVQRITVRLSQAFCRPGSRILLELFRFSLPTWGTAFTFVIEPIALSSRTEQTLPTGLRYRAVPDVNGLITVEITLDAPADTLLAGVRQGIVTVTHEPSLEGLDLPLSENIPLLPDILAAMRADPTNVAFGERIVRYMNKSMAFIQQS